MGVFSTVGRYHDACGDILRTVRAILSAVEILITMGDIMMHVGDIMSTMGVLSTVRDTILYNLTTVRGYQVAGGRYADTRGVLK